MLASRLLEFCRFLMQGRFVVRYGTVAAGLSMLRTKAAWYGIRLSMLDWFRTVLLCCVSVLHGAAVAFRVALRRRSRACTWTEADKPVGAIWCCSGGDRPAVCCSANAVWTSAVETGVVQLCGPAGASFGRCHLGGVTCQ